MFNSLLLRFLAKNANFKTAVLSGICFSIKKQAKHIFCQLLHVFCYTLNQTNHNSFIALPRLKNLILSILILPQFKIITCHLPKNMIIEARQVDCNNYLVFSYTTGFIISALLSSEGQKNFS